MFGTAKKLDQVFGISNTVLLDSYVDRGSLDGQIGKLLGRPTHIALRGESKCGKSWIRQKNVSDAIVVQCRLDRGVHDIYVDALSQLEVRLTLHDTHSGKITGKVEAKAKFGEGLIAKALGANAEVKGNVEGEKASESHMTPVGHDVTDLRFVADIIKASGKRLVVEDFHYLSVAERTKLAFDLKALWDYGLFLIIIGVWSQSNMLIFLNPDLSGRIEEIPIYWSKDDLNSVLGKGATALNVEFAKEFSSECVELCYGNVGILQSLAQRVLDGVGVEKTVETKILVSKLDHLNDAALQYADQLTPLYQVFAKRVSSGIRKTSDTTGIYAHTMAVILEASDELSMKGIPLDYIFAQAHAREPRIQKGNLRKILEKFEELQVDPQGRGLVISYNEAEAEVLVVDRQLLLYRKYSTVKWPWEDLILESKTAN